MIYFIVVAEIAVKVMTKIDKVKLVRMEDSDTLASGPIGQISGSRAETTPLMR